MRGPSPWVFGAALRMGDGATRNDAAKSSASFPRSLVQRELALTGLADLRITDSMQNVYGGASVGLMSELADSGVGRFEVRARSICVRSICVRSVCVRSICVRSVCVRSICVRSI